MSESCDMSRPPTKEEVYEIYKELREDGLVWTDAKASNIGRLRRPNKRYSNHIGEINESGEIIWGNQDYAGSGVGIETSSSKQDILETDEFVIIDLDYIWEENSEEIRWPVGGSLSREFEKRYCEEKESKDKEKEDER